MASRAHHFRQHRGPRRALRIGLGILAVGAAALLALSAAARAAEAPTPEQEAFSQLLLKIQANPGGASEDDVKKLIDTGEGLGRSYAVSVALKGYLAHNFRVSSSLLLKAADNALLAGDYRTAAARYKAYLTSMPNGNDTSKAAATLYMLLTDFLGANDDAYQFMTLHGEKLRGSVAARKFDYWYLDQARRRGDTPAMARMLHLVLAQNMPLEQERLYFWESLDWLMGEVVNGNAKHFAALPYCKRILPRIRGDKRRTLRYGVHVANLAFKAGAAGKEAAALDQAFEPVVAAANAYLSAYNSAETVQHIVHAFTNGGVTEHLNDGAWREQLKPKSEFFVQAFNKLNDAERKKLLEWQVRHRGPVARYLATREQWAELGSRHANLFRSCDAVRFLPFVVQPKSHDVYKKQAQFLQNVASADAAVINAMAATDPKASVADTLVKALDQLIRHDAWHLDFGHPYALFERHLWPAARDLATQGDKKPSDDERRKALVHFGRDVLVKSPVALDYRVAQAYVQAAWDLGSGGDKNDKSGMIPCIDSLQWVPYDRRDRKEIFSRTYQNFRNWSNWVRREARAKEPKVKKEALNQIAPLEQAFQRALDPNRVTPDKAPTPFCKALAQAIVAEDKRDKNGFLKAARELYPLVKDYEAKKTPFGKAALRVALTNRQNGVDKIDFQCEVLADQLKTFAPGKPNDRIRAVADTVVKVQGDKGWWRVPKQQMARTLKLNALFEKANLDLLAKNQFSPTLFDWFRGTRQGDHWNEKQRGEAVLAKIIDQKVFHKSPYRPHESVSSATCGYMWLVRNEFPGLNAKYPVENYFDDMFVEEATRTNLLDWRYWEYGRDEKKKVANAAAKILQQFDRLPLGYHEDKVVYNRNDYWNWQARALGAEAAVRDAMIAKIESTYGKTRFDTYAMGRAYFSTQADASTPGGRKQFFARLAPYLERVRQSPARVSPPYLGQIEKLGSPPKLTKQELDVLLSIFPDCVPIWWPSNWHFETLAGTLANALVGSERQADLYRLIPHLWRIARDTRNTQLQNDLTRLALQLVEAEQFDLALITASVGLDLVKNALPDDARGNLVAVRSKTLSQIGGVIPVKRDDKRYPIYAAQAAYLTGKYQSAWELYLSRRALVESMFKELDPTFSIWLIDHNTAVGDFDAAEALARKIITWFDSVADGFQPEVRARLLLSYANIAFARKEYPRARALYERIAAAAEFEGTRAHSDAQLRVAEVERQTQRYTECVERLERLARSKDPYVQAESYYQLALVKFDQEEYREALDNVEQVLTRVPDHANAKILEGRTKVKMRKLEEPTEIQVGTVTRKRFIVPGKPLKVNLEDRNLAVVGKSANIEIRAWSDSGDEEIFNLMPFGDSKTKFRGQVPTALAPVAKADGTLQVVGKDVVHYDFSDPFKKEHKIALSAPQALNVAADAELFVSSGKILSKEEQEARALEDMIRKRLDTDEPKQETALSTVRPENQIKPGNTFNVRVIDADRSATKGKDKITVRVATSSGDTIAAAGVEETDTHSGVFEGTVQTSSGQAVAFASDSDDGKEPNFVVSKKDYPAWVALPDNIRPKTFSIDLNDNVALGKMTITANVAGRKLKKFALQTSLNSRDFATVGTWPDTFTPWDGSLTLELVKFGNENRGPASAADFAKYLDTGYIAEGTPKFRAKPKSLAFKFDHGVAGQAGRMQLAGEREGSWYIAHVYGAFYQPVRKTRIFEIDAGQKVDKSIRYVLLVDGQEAETDTKFRGSLGKGVHRIDIYMSATRKANAQFQLMTDVDQPPFVEPVSPVIFDPAKNPQIRAGVYVEPATITAGKDNTTFDVAFAKDTRARVIRLLMSDFETDAPAINKITLANAAGETVLPTKEDFLSLRKNQVLEIVPGDRITVTYEDPKAITPGAEQHEAFLTATFSNATLSASFVEYTIDGQGERKARYIPMRRFKAGDKVSVFIQDPDCDVSDKQDTVTFTARTSEGKPAELPALETEEHSGIFIGAVFPIAADPKRETELKVAEGDDIILAYTDKENTDPGIPWTRTCIVEQTWYEPPELRIYEVSSTPLTEEEKQELADTEGDEASQIEEVVPVTHNMLAAWPERPDPAKPTPILINGPFIVEVIFPYIAQSPESTATLYVQTSSGLKAYGKAPEGAFDIKVQGTLKLASQPSGAPNVPPPPGYKTLLVRSNPYAADALDDGRFTFLVPMELGKLPSTSLATVEPDDAAEEPPSLNIKGTDVLTVAVEYKDPEGKAHWAVQKVSLGADAFFDTMDRRYRESIDGIYVGETLYFRLIDPTRDASDEKDEIEVVVKTSAGATHKVQLTETFMHTGMFKGHAKIVYKGDEAEAKNPGVLPVNYGDQLTATYLRPGAQKGLERNVVVHKGSDGDVVPFTKRFKDPAIAVQTQFTIAEAYFELAKRHRELGQDSLARREIAQGKKLLEEAIRDYPDTEARAQADYLLADLALEFANDAKNPEDKMKYHKEAVSRFTDIVASYPDSPYAPKAQYKKALVFEKMGLIDQACEEYVKLSYRYPDNELVAETIARLGQYFLTKGKDLRKQVAAEADAVEREKVEMQAKDMYKTAGQVFGRLAVRFPSHRLAGKTSVLSAQCYMQAEDMPKAVEVFDGIITDPKMDKDLVAESMYWCGDCYMKQDDYVNAYRMFKKLTWDYPASKWAKFARGRLTEEALVRISESEE